MKRRKFLFTSGSVLLGSAAITGSQKPAIGLDFELSTIPDKNPKDVDSLLVEFSKLEVTPRYLNEDKKITVQARIETDNYGTSQSSKHKTSFVNGVTKQLSEEIEPTLLDGIDADSFISGDVSITVTHPDLTDTHRRPFSIAGEGIPDSGVARYDATRLGLSSGSSINSWSDLWSNFDLSGSGSTYRESGLNGHPTVEFDLSSGDNISNTDISITQPYTMIAVVEIGSSGSSVHWFNSMNDNTTSLLMHSSDDTWELNAGNRTRKGTWSSNAYIISVIWDGSNSVLRKNGEQEFTTDAGTSNLEDIKISYDSNSVKISEMRFYNKSLKKSFIKSEESELSNKYDLGI